MSWESKEKASEIRRKFGYCTCAWFPVQEVALWYGLNVVVNNDPAWRYNDAYLLGKHLKVIDPDSFAKELLCPLWLLEPMIVSGRRTGEKWFFGWFEKHVSWTNDELAVMFGCSRSIIGQQLYKLT